MKQICTGLAALVTIAFLLVPSLAHSQAKAEPYRPLMNSEMSQLGIWDQWITTYSEMTGKQKAEVMRRHIKMCLDSFEMTEEQRAFVKEAARSSPPRRSTARQTRRRERRCSEKCSPYKRRR